MTQKLSIVMVVLAMAAMPFQASAASAVKAKKSTKQSSQKVLPVAAPADEAPAAASIRPTISDSKLMSAGLIGGLGLGNATYFNIGGDFSYRLTPDWGTGAYLTYSHTSGVNLLMLAGEGNYYLKGQLKGAHVGGKLGFARFSASGVDADIDAEDDPWGIMSWANAAANWSSTGLVLGGTAGYDYPITTEISVGGEANLLLFTNSGSSALFNVLGSVKYWF